MYEYKNDNSSSIGLVGLIIAFGIVFTAGFAALCLFTNNGHDTGANHPMKQASHPPLLNNSGHV